MSSLELYDEASPCEDRAEVDGPYRVYEDEVSNGVEWLARSLEQS